MSNIKYIQALSRLRSEIGHLVQDLLRYFPRLIMAKMSNIWQLALRGLSEPGAITTVTDYRSGRWFHQQAASWFDDNIDEPSEEGYSLDYFEFVQDIVQV